MIRLLELLPIAMRSAGLGLVFSLIFLAALLLAEFHHVPSFALAILGVATGGYVLSLTLQLAAELASSAFANRADGTRGRIAFAGTGVLLLTLLGAWTTWRGTPTERLLGIHDQAYYWGAALALEREGRAGVVLAPLANTSPEARAPWLKERQTQAQRARDAESLPPGRQAIGPLFVTGGDSPEARGVFPMGFSLAAAGIGKIGGPMKMFWANTFFTVGLAAAVGLIAVRIGGLWAGFAAWVLVLAHPLHIWISRTGYAEVLLAWLAWTAWWHLMRAEDERPESKLDALSAASLAAMLPAIKIDGILFSTAIGVVLIWRAGTRNHPLPTSSPWAPPLWWGGTSLCVWLGQNEIGGAYFGDTLRMQIHSGNGATLLIVGLAAVVAAAGALVFTRHREGDWRRQGKIARNLLMATAATTFVFLFWIRPRLGGEDTFYYWPRGGEIRSWREETLVRLGWFMHPAVLTAAFAGVLIAARRVRGSAAIMLFAVIVALLFLLSWDHRNNPLLPYAMRRMTSMVTPGLCLGLAWGLTLGAARLPGRLGGVLMPIAILALLALWLPIANRITPQAEYAGTLAYAQKIHDGMPPDAILLLPPTPVAQEFALALCLGFGRATLSMPDEDAALRRLEPELTRLSETGSDLYILLDAGARSDPRWQSLASVSLVRFEHRYHALTQTALKFPDEVRSVVNTVWIGRVRSAPEEERAP